MNIENRATKLYLKELAPIQVLELLDKYIIPTPYKEVLIVSCIERLDGFKAVDRLAEKYHIYIGYWTYVRRLKESLTMFRKSHIR